MLFPICFPDSQQTVSAYTLSDLQFKTMNMSFYSTLPKGTIFQPLQSNNTEHKDAR